MPKSIKILIFFVTVCVLSSCNNAKEKELQAREQQLVLKEKEFSEKEEDYKSLLMLRDSLQEADSLKETVSDTIISAWPDSLAGTWNSRLVCRESSCNTYVIGDQRTEKWILANDSLGPVVRVMDNNRLKRVLKAQYRQGKAMLSFQPDTLSQGGIKINAVLDDFNKKVIKGTQTLTGQDGCTVRFSIELSPTPKK